MIEIPKEDQIKRKILETAEKQFLESGYKKVTMDEIAEQLGMSKKTLYQYFQSKYELFDVVANEKVCHIQEFVSKVIDSEEIKFTDKIHKILECVTTEHLKMRPSAMLDIQKSVPEIWKKIIELQQQHIMKEFTKLMEIGISQGFIRNDIPPFIITMVYSNAVLTVLNPEVYSALQKSPAELFSYVIKIIYEGIFTEKGIQNFRKEDAI